MMKKQQNFRARFTDNEKKRIAKRLRLEGRIAPGKKFLLILVLAFIAVGYTIIAIRDAPKMDVFQIGGFAFCIIFVCVLGTFFVTKIFGNKKGKVYDANYILRRWIKTKKGNYLKYSLLLAARFGSFANYPIFKKAQRRGTHVETEKHPLIIGEKNKFYIKQIGSNNKSHVSVSLILLKTENLQNQTIHGRIGYWSENYSFCVEHLIYKTENVVDISNDCPFEREFSHFISPEDYVSSKWHFFPLSGYDQFDWFLKVSLQSKKNVTFTLFPIAISEA